MLKKNRRKIDFVDSFTNQYISEQKRIPMFIMFFAIKYGTIVINYFYFYTVNKNKKRQKLTKMPRFLSLTRVTLTRNMRKRKNNQKNLKKAKWSETIELSSKMTFKFHICDHCTKIHAMSFHITLLDFI